MFEILLVMLLAVIGIFAIGLGVIRLIVKLIKKIDNWLSK